MVSEALSHGKISKLGIGCGYATKSTENALTAASTTFARGSPGAGAAATAVTGAAAGRVGWAVSVGRGCVGPGCITGGCSLIRTGVAVTADAVGVRSGVRKAG